MAAILDHPYTEPTQIMEFNQCAGLIGCKPLHIEQEKAEVEYLADETQPPPTTDPSFSIVDIVKNVFSMVANGFPQWNLKAEEIDMLGDAWSGAIDYWFPDLTSEVTPVTNALLTTAIIAAPRILKATTAGHPSTPANNQTFGESKNE